MEIGTSQGFIQLTSDMQVGSKQQVELIGGHEAGMRQERRLLWRVRSEGSASRICPLSLSSWGNSLPSGSTEKSCKMDKRLTCCLSIPR